MEASNAEEEQEDQLAYANGKGAKNKDEYVRPLRIDGSYVSHCSDVCTTIKKSLRVEKRSSQTDGETVVREIVNVSS
jgi:hypothetical protein